MSGGPGKVLATEHPEIALGGLIALFTLLAGLMRGFASPAFGWWLTTGSAYWAFVLPIIVALNDGWSPRAGLVTAGAGLAWMLAFGLLTHDGAEAASRVMALFSLFITAVIHSLRKNARPKGPGGSAEG